MSTFDPSKPIDDPTVWYPKGQYVKTNTTRRAVTTTDDDDEDEGTFVLAQGDMGSLNRYLWAGKQLATTRTEYQAHLGMADTSNMTEKIWGEVDDIIDVYKTIKSDCSTFLQPETGTWDKIVNLAQHIRDYSDNAGGQEEDSYYANMLQWVGDYNKETDAAKKEDIKTSIQDIITTQIEGIKPLQEDSKNVRTALAAFHEKCTSHKTDLHSHDGMLKSLIDLEIGDIKALTDKIETQRADIISHESDIDADRLIVKQSVYYVWIPIFGNIAGAVMAANANADIAKLRREIQEINELIAQENDKIATATMLKADVSSMKEEISGLVDFIQPAIETLEKLEGAWAVMAGDLSALHDMFEGNLDKIPTMALEKIQLQKIVRKWNELHTEVTNYLLVAYLNPEPESKTIEEYIDDLDTVMKA